MTVESVAERNHQEVDLETLITNHLELASYLAAKQLGHGLDFDDLRGVAYLCLVEGATHYDPQQSKASTYFWTCIDNGLRAALARQGGNIYLPPETARKRNKIHGVISSLHQGLEHRPTHEEIAQEINKKRCQYKNYKRNFSQPLNGKKVQEILAHPRDTESLFASVSEDTDLNLIDTIPNPNSPIPEETVLKTDLHKHLEAALDKLPNQGGLVLRLQFGLREDMETDDEISLAKIGKIINRTRSRVSQINTESLDILSLDESIQQLKEYLLS